MRRECIQLRRAGVVLLYGDAGFVEPAQCLKRLRVARVTLRTKPSDGGSLEVGRISLNKCQIQKLGGNETSSGMFRIL